MGGLWGTLNIVSSQRNEMQKKEKSKEIRSPMLFVPNGTKANEAVSNALNCINLGSCTSGAMR